MPDLLQHIKQIIDHHAPDKLIVACSAGLDSTVLLHICARLKYPIEIAHVNYKLRGEDSDKDASFLVNLANRMNVPIHLKEVNLANELKNGGNLQELARKIRYEHFRTAMKNDPKTLVLLAHHREDQTETFFMNVYRNAGIMGLSCMPERRGRFLRPLLNISKSALKKYAIANEIKWREDATNQSAKYTRNKWRNEILPELRKTIPELDASVEILVQAFQATQNELEVKISAIHEKILETKMLPKNEFSELNEFEQVELCRALEQPVGILDTWRKLYQKGTLLQLQKNAVCPFDTLVFDGHSFSFLSNEKSSPPQLIIEKVASLPKSFSKWEVYLDANKINGELKVRRIRIGDRIRPIGMKGSRLVSDVVSDAKLTALQKQKLVVITDDKSILWIPGLSISREAIAQPNSEKISKISLK